MTEQTEYSADLAGVFVESVRNLGATVEVIKKSPETLCVSLQKATDGEQFVLLADPDFLEPELFDLFRQDKRVVSQPTKEQLSTIHAGVTDAFCGVASTGSVCVSVSKNLTSPASLLTRKHIAVVDAGTIVQRPRDVFSAGSFSMKNLNRSFSFITGPSATADMGPLVIGVHGPGELHIILLSGRDPHGV